MQSDRVLFGWRVRSELALPELPPWTGDDRRPDLEIVLGTVPERLPDTIHEGPFLQVDEAGDCRFEVASVGSFLVVQGNRVVIAPRVAVDSPDIGLFLLGTVFGILCHQREILPLHASCVDVDGRVVAFAGDSGAGKSTLAAALGAQGHRLLADDVMPVEWTDDGVVVRPVGPRQKLWEDSVRALNLKPGRPLRRVAGLQKFELCDGAAFPPGRRRLHAVFHLVTRDSPVGASVERLYGMNAVAAVRGSIYRIMAGTVLRGSAPVVMACSRLASSVPQYRLHRPGAFSELPSLVKALPRLVEVIEP